MNESYGGNIPARIWARFMKKALANVKPHDFVLPVGEVHKVKLCGTGRDEVFLSGTEPLHNCGTADDSAPVTTRSRKRASVPVPLAPAAVPIAKAAVPHVPPPVTPLTPAPDTIGDGQTFVRLDGEATSAPAPPKSP
jgi:membrane peptidoglycan carboxypeptidase